MIRQPFVEPEDFFLLGIIIIAITDVADTQENITTIDNITCSGLHCSTLTVVPTLSTEVDESCSGYPRGWGLQGSEWGCCGNYEGCCTYASLICYFHDAMCRCCDVGNNFCGPACKPEVECFQENEGNASMLQVNSANNPANLNESYVYNEKNQTILSDLVNETAVSAKSNPGIPDEFLDIEEIEKTIYNNDSMPIYNVGLEIERLLNETENLLNQNDGMAFNGSGDAEYEEKL